MREAPPLVRPKLDEAGTLWTSRIQWYAPPRRKHTRRELLMDRAVNFSGVVGACFGSAVLMIKSLEAGDEAGYKVSLLVYCSGLLTMMFCSAAYHYSAWRWADHVKLLSLDYIGINALIMGTYCPLMYSLSCKFTLITVLVLG